VLEGQYARGAELARAPLTFYESLGELEGQLDAYSVIGISARRMGNYDEALETQTRALELARSMDDPRVLARPLNNLLLINWNLGRLDVALE